MTTPHVLNGCMAAAEPEAALPPGPPAGFPVALAFDAADAVDGDGDAAGGAVTSSIFGALRLRMRWDATLSPLYFSRGSLYLGDTEHLYCTTIVHQHTQRLLIKSSSVIEDANRGFAFVLFPTAWLTSTGRTRGGYGLYLLLHVVHHQGTQEVPKGSCFVALRVGNDVGVHDSVVHHTLHAYHVAGVFDTSNSL